MKKLVLSLLVFVLGGVLFVPQQANAFSMSISPARKTLEVRRGQSVSFQVNFTNQAESTEYEVQILDFVYDESGSTRTIEPEELADESQSLTSWIDLDQRFQAVKGQRNVVDVTINVPQNASYGDHYGMLVFKKAPDDDNALLAIQGGISMILYVKVLGGQTIASGELVSFEAQSQQRARNTVNFEVEYRNTGNQFFNVLAEVMVYDQEGDSEPIKTLKKEFTSFPNVVSSYRLPLGDLGDNYGEREYPAQLAIYEYADGKKGKVLVESQTSFSYYLPYTGDEPLQEQTVVQKEVVVTPPIVDIIKELALYIGGFLIVLIVLVRVLFFHTSARKRKK